MEWLVEFEDMIVEAEDKEDAEKIVQQQVEVGNLRVATINPY